MYLADIISWPVNYSNNYGGGGHELFSAVEKILPYLKVVWLQQYNNYRATKLDSPGIYLTSLQNATRLTIPVYMHTDLCVIKEYTEIR